MHWKISHFYFNQEQNRLSDKDKNLPLEPIAARVLSYFCQHPHKDISRDELIEQVWRGQIVSDNAINRVIVQLRKALNDETKPRQFIATVPKYGYRFVSDVEAISQNGLKELHVKETKSYKLPIYIVGIAAVLIAAVWFFSKGQDPLPQMNANVSPLSRLSVWQYDADLSPDQRYLLYSVNANNANIVYLKDSQSETPMAVSPEQGTAYSARWSADGSYFVYQYQYDDICEFRKVDMNAGQMGDTQILQKCNRNADAVFAFGAQDDILYFLERENVFSPYEVFAFDMQEQQRWRLAQPVAVGLGNHYLDIHPETGKLLLVSDQSPGRSSIFELDLINKAYTKLHDFDYELFSAIWGHKDKTIVHPGEHPSYELMQTNIDTGQSIMLLSDSRRITTPRKIRNAKDYLFTSYLFNRDIEVSNTDDDSFNSAVMDYLPKLSRDGKELAFISKREGYSQLFIKNLETGFLTRFEPNDPDQEWLDSIRGRTYFSLDWSFDNKTILANTSRGFLIFDRQAMNISKILPVADTAYGSSWYDNQHIAYSAYKEGRWQLKTLNIETLDVSDLDKRWAFVISSQTNKMYLNQSMQLFENGETALTDVNCNTRLYRYQLSMSFDDDNFYCRADTEYSDLLVWNAADGVQRQAGVLDDAEFFSLANGRIAKTIVSSATSDIMRTNY